MTPQKDMQKQVKRRQKVYATHLVSKADERESVKRFDGIRERVKTILQEVQNVD